MSRERYQRGSLEKVGKRTKKWRGHWYVYVRQADGTEERVHKARILGRCANMTKGDAQRELDRIIAEQPACVAAKPAVVTFEAFVRDTYLRNYERTWASNTRTQYAAQLRNHIYPVIGALPIADVRKMHAVEIVRSMEDKGQSHKSIKATLALLHAIFVEATENGHAPGNPVTRRIAIAAPRQTGAKPTLTLDQLRLLLSRTTGRTRLLFRVLVLCGLRIGEALVLRWRCVEEQALRVSESTDKRAKGPKTTKTEVVRLAPLPADLRCELLAYREVTYYAGADDFIFGDQHSGEFMQRFSAHRTFLRPAREATGLGNLLDFRILRRTLATRLKERGVHTKDIQAILGHADAGTTTEHYIQPVEESQRRAVEAFAGLLQ